MLIECQQPRPVPSFSPVTDKSKNSRLALSAICNDPSQYAHHLPHSSRVTSPTQSSISHERTSPPVSHLRRSLQSPSSSANPRPAVPVSTEQLLPSISHIRFSSCQNNSASQFPSHPRRPHNTRFDHLTSYVAPQPCHRVHPCSLPSSSTSTDSPLTTAASKLPHPTKYHAGASMSTSTSADRLLPRPSDNSRTSPVSPIVQVPQTVSSYSRRRYSSQTNSRICTNCSISQTRQWVRGEKHAWLCHSCGQFWRKNGYPRPRALWNRPTFKRSSRKSRMVSQDDGSRRFKGSTRQTVSSSFLNGKKMIQWEIRLPPLQSTSDFRDLIGTRAGVTGRVKDSVEHTSRMPTEVTSNSGSPKVRSWRCLPTAL